MSETPRNSSVNVPPSAHRMSVRFSVVVWMNFASGRECVQFEGKEKTASQTIGSISITGGPRGSKGYPVLVKREDVCDIANYRPVLPHCNVCSVAEACYLTAITATKRGTTVYSYHNVAYNVMCVRWMARHPGASLWSVLPACPKAWLHAVISGSQKTKKTTGDLLQMTCQVVDKGSVASAQMSQRAADFRRLTRLCKCPRMGIYPRRKQDCVTIDLELSDCRVNDR